MMNDIEKSLNKGVPLETPITILCNDLLSLSSDEEKLKKVIDKAFSKYIGFLFNGNESLDIDFFETLSVVIDHETLERKVGFSVSGFFSSLVFNLNVLDMCLNYNEDHANYSMVNFADIEKQFLERIDVLKKCRKERKLKREFPTLYKKYERLSHEAEKLSYITKALDDSKLTLESRLKIRKELIDTLAKNGIVVNNLDEYLKEVCDSSIETFTEKYANCFTEIVNRIPEIVDMLLHTSIDLDSAPCIDREKFELYITHQFLLVAESGALEKEDIQQYLYYVSSYFSENNERKNNNDLAIFVGEIDNLEFGIKQNGKSLTPKALYERYQKLLIANPELHVIDFNQLDFSGMNLSEVQEFMADYLKDLSANWEFIPSGSEELESEIMTKLGQERSSLSEEEKAKQEQRLVELYMAKKEFWDNTDPFFRIKGKNTFDGYVGYIYTNGQVFLDKYYENAETGKLALGQAIYSMNINEFYQMSQLPKQALIRHPNCQRIIHRGDWQGKVMKAMSLENDSVNPACEVNRLIKSNKVKLND